MVDVKMDDEKAAVREVGAVSGEHTPGPWILGPKECGDLGYTGHAILHGATTYPGGKIIGGTWIASAHGIHVGVPLGQIAGNARLIAAAPDLLSNVAEWLVVMQPGHEPTDADFVAHYDRALAVYRKATGLDHDAHLTEAGSTPTVEGGEK